MITMRPVVEVMRLNATPPWQFAQRDPLSWLALHGACTDDEVSLFLALLADRYGVLTGPDPAWIMEALLAEELIIISGGVLIHDPKSGMTIAPSCCCGLEDWREWQQAPAGVAPWMGHSPDPEMEFHETHLRVWQNGDARLPGTHVDVPRSALPALLAGVRQDLIGFLDALRAWARRHGCADHVDAFIAKVDGDLAVSAELNPAGLTTGGAV
ncbi:hypothetical protein AB0B66_42680 [Catellatospora sp. NPDC049111]|uniref:hypothetical protein n=1 Tax=Catellatospora sp. NPDC049111 TaxID=3155271 RepID=UPI0033EB4471